MDCSMPGFPVYHQHLELVQTHVHRVGDAIQPFQPLLLFIKKKKSHKCPNWGTKTLSVLQKIVKIIKNKENLRNCYSKEKPKVIQFLHVIWYSGWDPGTEKGLKVKPREMRKKKKKKTLCIHVKVKWKWKLLNHIRLFVTSWTLQWVKFARPKYWSG